jgi:hypothetical protein
MREGQKNFGLASKVPSFKNIDFGQNSSASSAGVGSARCDVSVTPLQCEARYGRKTVSPSRIKCPSLLISADPALLVAQRQGVACVIFQSPPTPFKSRRYRKEKLLRPLEYSALHYQPISTKPALILADGQGVQCVTYKYPCCNARRDTDEKLLHSGVKCPSLTIDFKETSTPCSAWAGSAMSHISVTPLQCKGGDTDENIVSARSKEPFITDRRHPKFRCI